MATEANYPSQDETVMASLSVTCFVSGLHEGCSFWFGNVIGQNHACSYVYALICDIGCNHGRGKDW